MRLKKKGERERSYVQIWFNILGFFSSSSSTTPLALPKDPLQERFSFLHWNRCCSIVSLSLARSFTLYSLWTFFVSKAVFFFLLLLRVLGSFCRIRRRMAFKIKNWSAFKSGVRPADLGDGVRCRVAGKRLRVCTRHSRSFPRLSNSNSYEEQIYCLAIQKDKYKIWYRKKVFEFWNSNQRKFQKSCWNLKLLYKLTVQKRPFWPFWERPHGNSPKSPSRLSKQRSSPLLLLFSFDGHESKCRPAFSLRNFFFLMSAGARPWNSSKKYASQAPPKHQS